MKSEVSDDLEADRISIVASEKDREVEQFNDE